MNLRSLKDVDTYIKEHKGIKYCEAVITEDGRVIDAIPSHIFCIIALTGKSKSELDSQMPMYAAPLEWLIAYGNVVSIWYDSFIYSNITESQKETLRRLQQSGVLCNTLTGRYTNEYQHCKELELFHNGLVKDISKNVNKYCILSKESGEFIEYIQ